MESEQKSIDDYVSSVEVSIRNLPRDFDNYLPRIRSIERWINEQTTICKRVLRLRSYAYLKIPWFTTSTIWDYLLRSVSDYCVIPGNPQWITNKDYLGSDGKLLEPRNSVFVNKKQIYDKWVKVSLDQGYYAQKIYAKSFDDANYTVQENLKIPLTADSEEKTEIDIYAFKDDLHLGAQVKNITSEVFTDPKEIRYPSKIYKDLTKQFDCCLGKDIVPILIAPFIDNRFYNFTKRYHGLHCQTFLELFSPENFNLCYAVKDTLKFGNVKVVDEATQRVKEWIDRIPKMLKKRYPK